MNKVLSDLDGIVCQMDDTLVFGISQEEHDKRLLTTLSRRQSAGLTLNKEKCLFSERTITFLGHVIDSSGFRLILRKLRPSKICLHQKTSLI